MAIPKECYIEWHPKEWTAPLSRLCDEIEAVGGIAVLVDLRVLNDGGPKIRQAVWDKAPGQFVDAMTGQLLPADAVIGWSIGFDEVKK